MSHDSYRIFRDDIEEPSWCGVSSSPLEYSLQLKYLESVKLLLDAGSPLSHRKEPPRCQEAALLEAIECDDVRFMKLTVQALRLKRSRLYDFAKEQLSETSWRQLKVSENRVLDKDAMGVQEALVAFGIQVPDELWVHRTTPTVYHVATPRFTVEHADILFEAGFHDVDSADEHRVTPIHYACAIRLELEPGLDLIDWFRRKGANFSRIPENQHSEPAHCVSGFHKVAEFIGRSFFFFFFFLNEFWEENYSRSSTFTHLEVVSAPLRKSYILVRSLIQDYRGDACACACAVKGCSPIITLLKPMSGRSYSLIRESVISLLEAICASEGTLGLPLQVVEDIIRFQTFGLLGLTHVVTGIYPITLVVIVMTG